MTAWPTSALRTVAEVRVSNVDKKSADGELPVQLCNYTDVYYRTQITRDISFMEATATPQQAATFGLLGGDTLITKDSETSGDIGIPAYVPEDLPGVVCGYHLAQIRPGLLVHPHFLYWCLSSDFVRARLTVAATGVTRFGLTYGAIRAAEIPLPPLEEQRRIAEFLDDQTNRIDQCIDLRQEQADLLDEAMKSRELALTWTGLEPGQVELWTTGVDAAPAAPSHWLRARNKNLFRESKSHSSSGSEELLSVSHLTGVTPRSEKTVYMFEADSNEGYRIVQPGDLVINTMWAWMGALGVSSYHGIVSPAYGVYSPLDPTTFVPSYFDALYRSAPYVCEMTRFSTGVWSSRLRIYPEAFLRLPTIIPPPAEQAAIAREIEHIRSSTSPAIQALERSVSLLQERKRSLITAAVTGQLDVTTARGPDVGHDQ